MSKPNLGNIIRHFRMNKGYSQEYMAFKLGISQKTFSRLEQDGEGISLKRLEKISNLLDLEIKDIISYWFTGIDSTKNDVFFFQQKEQYNLYCTKDECPFKGTIIKLLNEMEALKKDRDKND